jgi:predicted ATPase
MLDWSPPVPALFLCTARPELFERSPSWGGGKRNATTTSLSPLSNEEAGQLLQVLLDRTLLPAETQTALLERAGGNPLYAEQFARMLVERGDVENLTVPETVQALMTARLDTVSPELKTLLQHASVVGRVFWVGAVAEMSGRARGDVRRDLNELARREFVRPIRVSALDGEDEFSFWHALVRDVAYQQIPRVLRADKHVRAAAWIEALSPDRTGDRADLLAHHYRAAIDLREAAGLDTADLVERARAACFEAGARSASLNANKSAVRHYTAALNLMDLLPHDAGDREEVLLAREEAAAGVLAGGDTAPDRDPQRR